MLLLYSIHRMGSSGFCPSPTLELIFENLCIQFNSPTIKRGIFSVGERIEGVMRMISFPEENPGSTEVLVLNFITVVNVHTIL